jgi:hypothetical protein
MPFKGIEELGMIPLLYLLLGNLGRGLARDEA